MASTSRVLDSQVFGEESAQGTVASTFAINLFGDVTNCSFVFDDKVQVVKGTTGGTSGHISSKLIDLSNKTTGSLSFMPHDLRFLKYFLTGYAEAAGEYTMTNASTALPDSLTIKGTYDSTHIVQVLGCYLNNLRLTLTTDEIVTGTADIIGLYPSSATETITYAPPSGDPLIFSGGVVTYNSKEWDIGNTTITLNPKFIQKWSCKTIVATKKRMPNEILRGGKFESSFNGKANINAIGDELTEMWGGTAPADTRSEVNLVLTFTSGSDTHVITIPGKTNKATITESDAEETAKELSFAGVGRNATVVGDL